MTSARGGLGFQVVDRPMTQQGLGGLKTGFQGPGRMIQDRTFYHTELRQRINLISAEISRLNSEYENIIKENANVASFEKRADNISAELRDLQGQLGDYNTLVDKLHTDADLEDIERHYSQLKAQNAVESSVLDDVFLERQQREASVKETQKQIEQERKRAEALINQLDPERRVKYEELKVQNARFVLDVTRLHGELEEHTKKATALQEELRQVPIKQRALGLHEKVAELRSRKRELEEAITAIDGEAGPQEKARLLAQVKEDNQETSAMERKITESEDQLHRMREEISSIDMEMDSQQGEKNAKYEELVKRDRDMQGFIDAFDGKWREGLVRNEGSEKRVVDLLERIKTLARHQPVNTGDLEGDLATKENNVDKGEVTMEGAMQDRDRRLQDLEKVNQLEIKLDAELKHLRTKIKTFTDDLGKIPDIESARKQAEEMKQHNASSRESLKTQRDELKAKVTALAQTYDAKKMQLNESETYTQLGALEQKLRQCESANFHLREYINSKNSESDYKPVATDVSQLMDEVNSQLTKMMAMAPAR
ncbi:Intraflagellar transport protein 74 [Rhizophlyctis rosea]|uniref:Intraflagellar transport protein 74 n=1 Tax=Rhizophlyctis rosea TaxID=64517 RepID=A0AAD5X0I1_9FUNG|nr:Intraflagellar transport protein 74 [Rhizophlyctis rosea]